MRTLIVAVSIIVFALVAFQMRHDFQKNTNPYPELQVLAKVSWSSQQYREYFESLAKDKGAMYAYHVLKYAPLSPGIDTHFLGHYIGYVFYAQKGIAGIKDCTSDFRDACAHALVTSAFLERGPQALEDIARVCAAAPGGRAAKTLCYHGLGHGIVAYLNYDFKNLPSMCKRATLLVASSTPILTLMHARFTSAYDECIGGGVMESIIGVHDPVARAKEQPIYAPDSDPLSPCDSSYVPEDARPACYTYITERLFKAAGGTFAHVDPSGLPKAFSYCDKIPVTDSVDRDACYGGFGKEFVGSVNNRDVRRIDTTSTSSLQEIRGQCALAPSPSAVASCNRIALSSLFWGGENDPEVSVAFCALDKNQSGRDACYNDLANQIHYFFANASGLKKACGALPGSYQETCIEGVRVH